MDIVTQNGVKLCRKGDYAQAIVLFDQVLQYVPSDEAALLNRAKAKSKLMLLDEALQDYNLLLKLDSENASYISDRGIMYFHLKQYDRAITDLNMACKLEPNNPYRYSSRAYLKDQLEDFQGAVEDYSEAIRLDPQDAISLNNRGLVEEKMGHLEQSKTSFKNADDILGITDESYPSPPNEVQKSDAKNDLKDVQPDNNNSYGTVISELFTSKRTRKEFYQFVIDKVTRKK